MNDDELDRKLRSVGKAAFVESYELFESFAAGKASRQHCIDNLVAAGISNREGASIRVGNAAAIFAAGKEDRALELVIKSSRVPPGIVRAARTLLGRRN